MNAAKDVTTDGLLLKSYETHCRRCEHPALGLGRSAVEATKTLRKNGWSKMLDRWYCGECASKGPIT